RASASGNALRHHGGTRDPCVRDLRAVRPRRHAPGDGRADPAGEPPLDRGAAPDPDLDGHELHKLRAARHRPGRDARRWDRRGERRDRDLAPALVLSAPKRLLTFVIVLAGVLSNTASEIGYVLLVPLAATIFLAAGRHPLAGLAAAFAGVSGGDSANLMLGTVDPLLAGLSEEAARIIDPSYQVNATANYYFMFVSTFFIAAAGTWVTERIVAPRLGDYTGSEKAE